MVGATDIEAELPRVVEQDRVAIVGGGASGVLTAFQLLAGFDDALGVTVHEASGVLGRGIAYATSDPRHLLNVRAGQMSAYADVPSDLLEWAARAGRNPDPRGFLPRMEYAAYLQDTLAAVADHRLTISAGRVDDIVAVPGGFELRTRDRVTTAGTVVLAYGNQKPQDLPALSGLPGYLGNPWDLASLRALSAEATVVLVGPRVAPLVEAARTSPAPSRRAAIVQAASPLGEDGLIVRIAGTSVEDVTRAARGVLAGLPSILGDDPFARKW